MATSVLPYVERCKGSMKRRNSLVLTAPVGAEAKGDKRHVQHGREEGRTTNKKILIRGISGGIHN